MSRDLTDLLAEAVPSHGAGPDLVAIEARAARRRRSVTASSVIMVLALVFGVARLLPDEDGPPVIGLGPEASVCHATGNGRQVLDEVDLDGDGATDRVVMEPVEDGSAELIACLADGRVTRVSGVGGTVSDPPALAPTRLGAVDAVLVLGDERSDGRRRVDVVWLVDGVLRATSTWRGTQEGADTTMEPMEHRVGDDVRYPSGSRP